MNYQTSLNSCQIKNKSIDSYFEWCEKINWSDFKKQSSLQRISDYFGCSSIKFKFDQEILKYLPLEILNFIPDAIEKLIETYRDDDYKIEVFFFPDMETKELYLEIDVYSALNYEDAYKKRREFGRNWFLKKSINIREYTIISILPL